MKLCDGSLYKLSWEYGQKNGDKKGHILFILPVWHGGLSIQGVGRGLSLKILNIHIQIKILPKLSKSFWIIIYIYIPPYFQLRTVLEEEKRLDREVGNELILELEIARGEGRQNVYVCIGD